MEDIQTESPSTYENKQHKHSVVVGKDDLDSSKSDDEYASSGFYVREKSDAKSVEESPETSCDNEDNVYTRPENGDGKSPKLDEKDEENPVAEHDAECANKNEGSDTESAEQRENSLATENHKTKESPNLEETNQIDDECELRKTDSILSSILSKGSDKNGSIRDKAVNGIGSGETEDRLQEQDETKASDSENESSDDKIAIDSEKIESKENKKKSDNSDKNLSADTITEIIDDSNDSIKSTSNSSKETGEETEGKSKDNSDENFKDNKESEVIDKKGQPESHSELDIGTKDKDENSKCEEIASDPKDSKDSDVEDVTEKVADTSAKESKDISLAKESTDSGDVDSGNKEKDSSKMSASSSKEKNNEEITSNVQKSPTDNADKENKEQTEKTSEIPKANEQGGNTIPSSDQGDEEEMEYDFDPSLFCPDISMDVDEAPVITNDNNANDGSTSPLPYEQSFSTFVDEMTGAEISFDLTPEEQSLRERIYGPTNPVQFTKIHCTACNVHLGSALDGQKNRFVHPLLKVLICKNCYHFYTSGEFEKDEDGSELYCRWCGQGGQVLCCSSCEFVFCKRCIKNNFGMKKFKEIRDSDDWNCFRCEPQQLSILRASCAEFIDYVRAETAKASTLAEHVPTFMATDHTTCCNPTQKKKDVEKVSQPPKRKRKLSTDDPDFTPESLEPDEKKPSLTPTLAPMVPPGTSGVVLVPKPLVTAPPNRVGVVQVSRPGTVFRLGQQNFRPRVQQLGYTVTRPAQRVATPSFIKVMPPRLITPRPQPQLTTTTPSRPTFSTIRPRLQVAQPTQMKHEWFEKTVRAAARVNSNLSYTLTQLNRQQSTASSVEGLALIHNKLQEVLSTSINSLIQIRKNLRTEFIAGIKNIKFPPKATVMVKPQVPAKDDDDVIFVNPTSASVVTTSSLISLPSAITLTSLKKSPPALKASENPYANPTPSTSYTIADTSVRKGGYLKVKSFSALQNVSSECITIPDDPLPPPPALTPISRLKQLSNAADTVTVIEESPEKKNGESGSTEKDKDAKAKDDDDDVVEIIDDKKEENENVEKNIEKPKVDTVVINGDDENSLGGSDKASNDNECSISKSNNRKDKSNVVDYSDSYISFDKKLKSNVFISIKRSKEIEILLKQREVLNGDM